MAFLCILKCILKLYGKSLIDNGLDNEESIILHVDY